MQRTNLEWDKYIEYLIDAINSSKFMKRAENKPMSTPKADWESHISTRSMHLRESADIIKRLAKGLGLNEDFAYAAMLMHDAGHPFSAHEGEEIFTYIGELYDTQFFHHNAKGIEIILTEDICGKAIAKIPNIDAKPDLRKKLQDEFYYFLDIIISHDGEASKKDMEKPEKHYDSIQEAIYRKLISSNAENNYKFIAQTPEGKLAKYADVIAYLSSDMQDAFRLGIIKDFSDDYLELFGEMLSDKFPGPTREEKIEQGKEIIRQIKMKNLTDTSNEILKEKDKDIQKAINSFWNKVNENKLDFYSSDFDELNSIMEEIKKQFKEQKEKEYWEQKGKKQNDQLEEQILKKIEQGETLSEEEEDYAEFLNRRNAKAEKIEDFATKLIKVRTTAAYEVTSKMREFFIDDVIRNSQGEETPRFSPAASRLFFRAKELNYKEFVQYTNWDYQTTELPEAARQLVNKVAISLVKSGAIRNGFYNDSIREYIKDPEALKYMKTRYRREEDYTSYRKEHGMGSLKAKAKPSSERFTGTREEYELMKLYGKVYHNVENQDIVFAIRYENTYHAVKHRVKERINTALSKTHKTKNKLFKQESQISR